MKPEALSAALDDEPNGRTLAFDFSGLDDQGVAYFCRKLYPGDRDRLVAALTRQDDLVMEMRLEEQQRYDPDGRKDPDDEGYIQWACENDFWQGAMPPWPRTRGGELADLRERVPPGRERAGTWCPILPRCRRSRNVKRAKSKAPRHSGRAESIGVLEMTNPTIEDLNLCDIDGADVLERIENLTRELELVGALLAAALDVEVDEIKRSYQRGQEWSHRVVPCLKCGALVSRTCTTPSGLFRNDHAVRRRDSEALRPQDGTPLRIAFDLGVLHRR